MSTKPSTVPTWDTNQTNTSAATSGHGTDGYATDEVPTSAEINWLLYWLGQWCQYVSDGAFVGASLELTGNLKVDGTTELVGAAKADSTLEVDGLLTASAGASVTGGTITDTLSVTSRATVKKKLNAIVGFQAPLNSNGLGNVSATPFALFMLDVPVGAVITQIFGWFNKASSGSSTLSFATGAWGDDPTTFTTAFPAPSDLVTSVGAVHEMNTAASTYTVVSGTFPYITLSGSVADDFVCGAEVWFTPAAAV